MGNKILVVCGPTASGKTALGVELARRLGGEVVSADSMQVYRGMDIGTAKPTKAEMGGIPHHMLDVAAPTESYSAARYAAEASACTDDILARGRLPIVVGGTGLYIDALVSGTTFAPFSGAWRKRLETRAEAEGMESLLAELRAVDPARAEKLHPSDRKRVIRALEVWYETGVTITDHDAATRAIPPRYDALRIGLNFANRADLNARIDARVEDMFARGLEGEVRALLDAGVPGRATAMQAIGYKELAAAIREGRPLSAAAGEIKLRSRQYAKRQMTWFSRTEGVRWIVWDKMPNFADALRRSTQFAGEFGVC